MRIRYRKNGEAEVWVGICSAHQRYDKDCENCQVGVWRDFSESGLVWTESDKVSTAQVKFEDVDLSSSGIVMPIHNAFPYVLKSLTHLRDYYPKIPICLVDDCSDEPVKTFFHDLIRDFDKCWVLRNERQQLFTRTVNRGIRSQYDDPDIEEVFIINSDCDFKPLALEALKACLDIEGIGLAGYTDSPRNETSLYSDVLHPHYVTGHCLAVNVGVFEKVGVFCETDMGGQGSRYPEFSNLKGLAHIGSDRFFSEQVRKGGWKTVYCNHFGVEHRGGQSWQHNLGWLSSFNLDPLWPPKDTL